jgi:formylglycine-generating enzyme required for sulfatase activity
MRISIGVVLGIVSIAAALGPQAVRAPLRRGDTTAHGGVSFVGIPAGEFVMGDSLGRGPDTELPARRVRIDAFWMARTETTVTQWKAFLDDSGHPPGRSSASSPDHPVVGVTWEEAQDYCDWFSRKHGVTARLPTEAEWEYAGRGGLEGKQYPNGDSISPRDANYDSKGPVKVASYRPNGYGLYDMAGNVFEWVADWYDPRRPQRRADRGGGWCMGAAMARVSARHAGPGSWDMGGTADCLGFRPVMEPVGPSARQAR